MIHILLSPSSPPFEKGGRLLSFILDTLVCRNPVRWSTHVGDLFRQFH